MNTKKLNNGTLRTKSEITGINIAVFLLFFASGVSGLIYEVVWTRKLMYIFGATLFAVATVLSAFMGGLALGSWLFGKYADKSRNNLRLYGYLQIGIGLSALFLPFILSMLDPIYKAFYQNFNASFIVISLLRFVLTFAVLLIPTTLMGGTLPVLSRFLVKKKESLGLNIGVLYSMNTLGAVLGCFMAGFILIASIGIRGTTYIAVGLNLAVALTSILLSRGMDTPEAAEEKESAEKEKILPEDEAKSRRIVFWVLGCYAVSGFVALSYQVAWNRALVFCFEAMKNTTYSFTAMLTVFLVGLALGGSVMSAFIDKQKDPLRLFGLIQVLIGLFGAFSFYMIFYIGPTLAPFSLYDKAGEVSWLAGVLNVFVKTGAAIFIPTFLMGMAFPVVTRICVDRIGSVGFGVGRLYSLNTIGAIVGSFASGFILVPVLGLAGCIYLLSIMNLMIALVVFLINPFMKKQSRTILVISCIVIALVLLIRMPHGVKFQELAPTDKEIYYKEGPLATVSVLENSFKYRTIYVDNVGVAGTDRILLTDQKSLAHIPMLLLKDPKSALTVGFGSGGASYSYTRYESMEDIHCVEICKTVMDTAPDLLASNHGILLPESRKDAPMPFPVQAYKYEALPGYKTYDKRYKIILDDVRSYLRFTGKKYDIIATDCTDLRYKSNANLYDDKYFELCRDHVTDDGMVVVWMPLAGLSDEMFRLALRTFYKYFPEMSIWYMNNDSTHYILIIGTRKPLKIDYSLMKEKLKEKTVKEDLAELFLDDVDKLLSCFLCDQTTLDKYLEGTKINSENRPYLEFESPKYGYGDKPLLDNLDNLVELETSILPYLKNIPDRVKFEKTMKRYSKALPYIIKGHAHFRNLVPVKACKDYMKASEIVPEDRATKYLLDFDEIKLRIEAHPKESWAYRELGECFFMQKRYADAVTVLSKMIRNCPKPNEDKASKQSIDYYKYAMHYANKTIGNCYIKTGSPEMAKPYLKKASEQ
jgi:spermidine synthase